jgi:hypothetical protein
MDEDIEAWRHGDTRNGDMKTGTYGDMDTLRYGDMELKYWGILSYMRKKNNKTEKGKWPKDDFPSSIYRLLIVQLNVFCPFVDEKQTEVIHLQTD